MGERDAKGAEPEHPLELRGVTKRFGGFTAVNGVDLSVRDGEIFALLGPNGAGKTTLISCIAGLSRHTSGDIRVFGHDTRRDFRTTRRLVGLVPQEINFDPFFTPLESLEIQMGFMGVEPDRDRCEELLRLFSLWDHRHAYTRHLSGGMKRRLLVAKALVHDPKLLFLDEPTAGVDVELRKDLWNVVRQLRDRGTTIILTTHYLEEAEELADRIAIIHRGRIVTVDERDQLMGRHREGHVCITLPDDVDGVPDWAPAGTTLDGARCLVVPWHDAAELEQAIHVVRERVEPLDICVRQTTLEEIFVDLVHAADEGET
ncbi:MAG: ABC transporter ATP-binding protein [Myxococcota bacterium]